MSWLVVAAWIAPPLALVLELVHARRAVAKRERLAEAWLAAGARPIEALVQVRRGLRPALLVALALFLPALAWNVRDLAVSPKAATPGPPAAVLWGLGGIAAASVLASVLATLRSFVDFRLVDRAPPEARAPFRLRPHEPPATLEVYESRPPRDGSP
jgi:hypothetical protein